MIDLRTNALPDAVVVDGKALFINTDFKVWLNFEPLLEDNKIDELFDLVFTDEAKELILSYAPLSADMIKQLLDALSKFYVNENLTPKKHGGSERIVDYIEDGEYIYASFLQSYGIDLIDAKMHWHKFKALFVSLPTSTKITEIMGYRSYQKSSKSQDRMYAELKKDWALPYKANKEEQNALDKFNKL